MYMLEAIPDSTTPPSGYIATLPSDDTPAHHEQLAVLVSTGKLKEAIGVQLTHDQVKRLTGKDIEKYNKRYETHLIQSFLLVFSKGVVIFF